MAISEGTTRVIYWDVGHGVPSQCRWKGYSAQNWKQRPTVTGHLLDDTKSYTPLLHLFNFSQKFG